MDEWVKLALEIGTPIIAAIIGYIVLLERLRDRQREQEKALHSLKAELEKSIDKIEERIDNLPNGFKLEIGTHRDDLDGSIRELKSDIEKVRDKVERIRDSSSDFAKEAELAKFVFEVNDRFEKIVRAIGNLEGTLYNERGRRDR